MSQSWASPALGPFSIDLAVVPAIPVLGAPAPARARPPVPPPLWQRSRNFHDRAK